MSMKHISNREEKYIRMSETAFIDCLTEFGNKTEQLLAFMIYNVNHSTNELNFTESETADFIIENSLNIARRKIHESINSIINDGIAKKLDDGKFIFNPFYINSTKFKIMDIYGKYVNTNMTKKTSKKLKLFDGEVKPIGSFKTKTEYFGAKKTVDYNFIRLYIHNLSHCQKVFTSKRVIVLLRMLELAEKDDRAVFMTQKEMAASFGVKQDTIGEVLKYLTKKNYILKEHNGKYMFNPEYISRSGAYLRAKNSKKYNELVTPNAFFYMY